MNGNALETTRSRVLRKGLYEEDWGCLERDGLGFEDVLEFVGMD